MDSGEHLDVKLTKAQLTVSGDDPRNAGPPLFGNFVAVSHVGTEVQFEFVFLDLNQLALKIEQVKKEEESEHTIQGRTVAKIVVPVSSFLQLKQHLLSMFERLEALNEPRQEEATERGYGD